MGAQFGAPFLSFWHAPPFDLPRPPTLSTAVRRDSYTDWWWPPFFQEPEDLFETISQTLMNAVDRDAFSGWGAIVHIM